jgi:hypothetical protein
MASVSRNRKTGGVTFQFKLDGKRRTMRLGKASQRTVTTFKPHLEELLEARAFSRSVYNETSLWANRLLEKEPKLYQKLADLNLVPQRTARVQVTLGGHLAEFLRNQTDKKASTIVCLTQCCKELKEYFGSDRPLTRLLRVMRRTSGSG